MKNLVVLYTYTNCNCISANSNILLYEPKISNDIKGLYTDNTKKEILLSS